MNKDKKEINNHPLEFNTYCIFTEDKQEIGQTIGFLFKDYIENLKAKI